VVSCPAQRHDRDLLRDYAHTAFPHLTGDADAARVADLTRPVDEPVDRRTPRDGTPAAATTTGGTR
jgi:hypothetical protein